MGYLDDNRQFVSELTSAELTEYQCRAVWLAKRWFTHENIGTYDLGHVDDFGNITAVISESYHPGDRRISYSGGNAPGSQNELLLTTRYQMYGRDFAVTSAAYCIATKTQHGKRINVGFKDLNQFTAQFLNYLRTGDPMTGIREKQTNQMVTWRGVNAPQLVGVSS